MFQLLLSSVYTSQGLSSVSCSEEVLKKPWSSSIVRTGDPNYPKGYFKEWNRINSNSQNSQWRIFFTDLDGEKRNNLKGHKHRICSFLHLLQWFCVFLQMQTHHPEAEITQSSDSSCLCNISFVTMARPRNKLHGEHNPGTKAEGEEKISTGNFGHRPRTFIRNLKGKLNIVIAAPFHQWNKVVNLCHDL